MEVDQVGLRRQLSEGAQVAIIQQPRPSPMTNMVSEGFLQGTNTIEFAKAHFKTLGPPGKDDHQQANLQERRPVNALTTFASNGNLQAPQMGTLGSGPFGPSNIFRQSLGSRQTGPMLSSPFGQTPPPGQFSQPAAAASPAPAAAPPSLTGPMSADVPTFVPG